MRCCQSNVVNCVSFASCSNILNYRDNNVCVLNVDTDFIIREIGNVEVCYRGKRRFFPGDKGR